MTVTKAVRGLKSIIQQRKEMLRELDELSGKWKHDSTRQIVGVVQGFLNNEIGALEWILSELQNHSARK